MERAIDASLAIRTRIEQLQADSGFPLNISIGISSGEMISGNIGSATLRRLDDTVIGDAVNTSQRLQSIASCGQIMIMEGCFEKVKQSFNCRNIGAIKLKNKEEEVIIYEVLN